MSTYADKARRQVEDGLSLVVSEGSQTSLCHLRTTAPCAPPHRGDSAPPHESQGPGGARLWRWRYRIGGRWGDRDVCLFRSCLPGAQKGRGGGKKGQTGGQTTQAGPPRGGGATWAGFPWWVLSSRCRSHLIHLFNHTATPSSLPLSRCPSSISPTLDHTALGDAHPPCTLCTLRWGQSRWTCPTLCVPYFSHPDCMTFPTRTHTVWRTAHPLDQTRPSRQWVSSSCQHRAG